jgi:type IV secretion system protein TrbL
MVERDETTGILVAFVRKLVHILFFFMVLFFADTWIPAVIDSFAEAGRRASALPELDPSTVLDQGVAVANTIYQGATTQGWLQNFGGSLTAVFTAVACLFAFVVIAGQMVIVLVEMYIVLGGGVFMLAFAGSRFTAPFAERFLSYSVGVGVKMFVLYLIVGVGSNLAAGWTDLLADSATNIGSLFTILGASVIYMFVAWSIPSFASAMMSGTVSLTLGSALATGAMVGSAGIGAAAMLAGAAASGRRSASDLVARIQSAASLGGGGGAPEDGGSTPGGSHAAVGSAVAALASQGGGGAMSSGTPAGSHSGGNGSTSSAQSEGSARARVSPPTGRPARVGPALRSVARQLGRADPPTSGGPPSLPLTHGD